MKLIAIILVCLGVSSCVGVRPFEKEYLLHPLMDEGQLVHLQSDFQSVAFSSVERLSATGAGGGGSTSCPTCGG